MDFVTTGLSDSHSGLKQKKPIETKYRMPLLNWQALRSHQVTGTVFHELDDEVILQVRLLLAPSVECVLFIAGRRIFQLQTERH